MAKYITKAEIEKENQALKILVDKQIDYITRQQSWILNVCKYIAENNDALKDINSYLNGDRSE